VEEKGLEKDRQEDTWKQTAMLNYFGRYYPDDDGSILREINWDITRPPTKLYKYVELVDNIVYLEDRDYLGIVFRDPVKITVPSIDEDENIIIEFKLIPDTPVGSTLKHTLDQVYRKMYGAVSILCVLARIKLTQLASGSMIPAPDYQMKMNY
jgi:hypothetical protein